MPAGWPQWTNLAPAAGFVKYNIAFKKGDHSICDKRRTDSGCVHSFIVNDTKYSNTLYSRLFLTFLWASKAYSEASASSGARFILAIVTRCLYDETPPSRRSFACPPTGHMHWTGAAI